KENRCGRNYPTKNDSIKKLFGKSEDRRGKVVLESTMMKKGHLKIKTNSQAQESECDDDDIPSPKEINICVSRQKISMKDWVKDLDLDDDKAVSDSESVEGCHAKCFGLFRRDKGIEGKIVPKSENYLKITAKPEPRKLNVGERLIKEPTMSCDNDGQIETTLVEELHTLIPNEESPVTATIWKNQSKVDKIENDQETVKKLARELPEDQQDIPMEIV
ncbi:51_t:CDS:2, partial [Acaulospora morrowiae]